MAPAVILSVVAFIAGHPTQVACDPTLNGHPAGIAWTAYGSSKIYAAPDICTDAAQPVDSWQFAYALGTFIHEAAHARGIRSESCAELVADIGVYDVLRRFYNIPFFTVESETIGGTVLANSHRRGPEYQPEACWATGTLR